MLSRAPLESRRQGLYISNDGHHQSKARHLPNPTLDRTSLQAIPGSRQRVRRIKLQPFSGNGAFPYWSSPSPVDAPALRNVFRRFTSSARHSRKTIIRCSSQAIPQHITLKPLYATLVAHRVTKDSQLLHCSMLLVLWSRNCA